MEAKEMILELLACFVAPPEKMQERMFAVAASINADDRKAVLDRIIETESSSIKISVKNIVEACRAMSVGFHEAKFIPAVPWQCAACGHEFKYTVSPSDDDRIDRFLYDACPMCGFQPGWTKLRDTYHGQGIATDWYDRQLAECRASFGPRIAEHKVKKGDMNLFRGGVFWKIDKARAERAEGKRMEIADEMAAIDRAKRYDLERDSV